MSNDLKFWIARCVVVACIAIDLSLLARIKDAAMNPAHPHLTLIVVLLFLIFILSIPAVLYYYYAKSRRWETRKEQDQIALETLSKLGEQRKKDNS